GRQRCLTPTGHAHSRISPDTPGVRHPKGVRHQPCHAPQPHQSGYFRCLTPKGCLTPTVPRPTATSVQILQVSDTQRVSDTNRAPPPSHTRSATPGVCHPKGVRDHPCHPPQPHQPSDSRCLTPKGCPTPTVPRPTATPARMLQVSDTQRVSDTSRATPHSHTS